MPKETRESLREPLLIIATNIQEDKSMADIASDLDDAQKIAEQLYEAEEC
jgi:hypothetical protein